jgi:thiol-disulfide isomerase/thioredoxin
MTEGPAPRFATQRIGLIVAGAMAGAAAGFAGVYGITALRGNAGADKAASAACAPAVELARKLVPLAQGEVAAVAMAKTPLKLPDLTFQNAGGEPRSLQNWRGRTVLLNLWATWCVPCRREMPALDALQAKLGGTNFEVVAINIDTRDAEKPKAWLKEVGIEKLAYYADPSARTFQDFKSVGRAFGMPTTLLIDPAGCEIGSIAGPAEWSSADAVTLIEAALGKP